MADDVVQQTIRQVKLHGRERDLLIGLLKEQAVEGEVWWTSAINSNKYKIAVEAGRKWFVVLEQASFRYPLEEDSDPDTVAIDKDSLLSLILSLARFLPE